MSLLQLKLLDWFVETLRDLWAKSCHLQMRRPWGRGAEMHCQLLILTVVPQQDSMGPSSDRSSPISSALVPLRVCGGILCHVRLLATPRIIACQAPLSIRFFRQEYWSGLLFPIPGDLPDSGIELKSLVAPALAGRFFTSAPSGNPTPLRSTWIIVFYANFLSCFVVAKKHPLPNERG